MTCGRCKSFKTIQNTEECGQGICSFPDSWFPVHKDDTCHLMPTAEILCAHCDRLATDTACMTCEPEDSAMHNGQLCCGFIDIYELKLQEAILTWQARGWNYKAIIEKVIQEVETAPRPGQPKE